jgi:hypothetical protein
MKYFIRSFHDLTALEKNIFFEFLKEESLEKNSVATNMWDDDWRNKPNTLPWMLENSQRFKGSHGLYNILIREDNQIAACSGVYISDFSQFVSIAGVRTWTVKNFRHLNLSRDYLLPYQKQWSINKRIKIIALTFNDYNKNIIKTFQRSRLGEKRIERKEHHLFYNGITEVDFPIIIRNTKQWVIYEKLNSSYDFDWNKIKFE